MSRRSDLLRYVGARLALAPVMLWLIASLVFLLLRVAPGDPIDALLGPRAPEAARTALRHQLGLDLPLQDHDLMPHRTEDRHDEIEARIQRAHIFAELLNDMGLRLRDDPDGFHREDEQQDDS